MLKLFLVAGLALGQTPLTSIDCGGPTDTGFLSGTAWPQADMGAGVLSTMRFGSRFSYRVPAPAGAYLVRFLFVEPNATAVGQRRFTIAVNGQMSDPIDVFKEVGARPNGYRVDTTAVSYFGRIVIEFAGMVGSSGFISNAIVNAIEVYPLSQAQVIAESYECIAGMAFGPTPAAGVANLGKPNCAGIRAAIFTRPDGSRSGPYFMIPFSLGVSVPPVTDASTWRPAPIL